MKGITVTIGRHISVGFVFATFAVAAGCAGNDGASTSGAGTEGDAILAPGGTKGATKPLLRCDELPAGSKAKCVPADDSPPVTGVPTVHVVGDVTTVPITCRLYDGKGGTWLPTSASQGLGSPLSDRFCELVWMAVDGSAPDWGVLAAGYPGVKFTTDSSCTDTICANPAEPITSQEDHGGPTGGATCNACLEGTIVGRAVNGTLYITLPATWVQSSTTSLHVFRPWAPPPHTLYYSEYVVTFPAHVQSLRVSTGTSVNGLLFMDTPSSVGGGLLVRDLDDELEARDVRRGRLIDRDR